MNDDNKQAILAELEAQKLPPDIMGNDRDPFGRGRNHGLDLAIEIVRRYDKAPEPMKTRMSWEQYRFANLPSDFHTDLEIAHAHDAWNAALVNAQQGGRFEVGDVVEYLHAITNQWTPATIRAVDGTNWSEIKSHVRPAPKTVDLTVEEKRVRLMNAIVEKEQTTQVNALAIIIDALHASQDTSKTLDQLCAQYGVETTRSV